MTDRRHARCILLIPALLLAACAASGPRPALPPSSPRSDTLSVVLRPSSSPTPPAEPERPIEEWTRDSLLSSFATDGLPHARSRWVDSVVAGLTDRERVAQVLVVYATAEEGSLSMLRRQMQELPMGGVLVAKGTSRMLRRITDSLRAWCALPPFVGADYETGAGMRLSDLLALPPMMALGATGRPDLAYEAGRAIGREARALGVNQIFAPVCDINTNPDNPIINTRSFGEDPASVAALAESLARGLQDERVVATAKHFPGHGDTHVDSHTDLPVLSVSRDRLRDVELQPFRRLIESGVLSVMTGHLGVPSVDPDSTRPASLSPLISDSLLRGELGFRGLCVTDAMNMQAITRRHGAGRAAVLALRAGADLVLMPDSPRAACDSVLAALHRGELSRASLERSLRRVLTLRRWLGGSMRDSLAPASQDLRRLADEIARAAITRVRDEGKVLPVPHGSADRLGLLLLTTPSTVDEARALADSLRVRHPKWTVMSVVRGKENGIKARALVDSFSGCSRLLIATMFTVSNGGGPSVLSLRQRQIAESLLVRHPRSVLLTFGTPYVARDLPRTLALLCCYGIDPSSRRAGIDALFGLIPTPGLLPVTIPGVAARGTGDPSRSTEATTLRFREVDSLILGRIRDHTFPGAQLAVVHRGTLTYLRSYGSLTYAPESPRITDSTRYDLASVSKVFATTSLAMRYVDRGLLSLDSSVGHWLPAFTRGEKASITLRHLLLHTAGLPPFIPFHRHVTTAEQVKDSIDRCPLESPPGTRMVYSDLGMITLGRVLEMVGGARLDTLVQREVFTPLGLHHCGYRPDSLLRAICAPTEQDDTWRMRLVQGTVHDETAALLDGVAGHAGVFSTAEDLARFAIVLLDSGRHAGRPWVSPTVLRLFTSRVAGSSRALGWDLRSSQGSSAGRYFSSLSFGHTGFTGTSIWIDPVTKDAVIFLTNRVHPTRENRALLPFRAILHDAVRKALLREQ